MMIQDMFGIFFVPNGCYVWNSISFFANQDKFGELTDREYTLIDLLLAGF
jgi:hypothetical protein